MCPPVVNNSQVVVTPTSSALPYVHMATVFELKRSAALEILVAWQASTKREGSAGQHIRIVKMTRDGKHTDDEQQLPLPTRAGGALWGPVLFTDDDLHVHIFYSESYGTCTGGPARYRPGGDIMTSQAYLPGDASTWSLKELHWSEPRVVLSMDEDAPVPKVTANKPIAFTTDAGMRRWVLPFWREPAQASSTRSRSRRRRQARLAKRSARQTALLANATNTYHECRKFSEAKQSAGVLVSDDSGATWRAHGALRFPTMQGWLLENAVAYAGRDTLVMVFRTSRGHVYGSRSVDAGLRWGEVKPLRDAKPQRLSFLPNPSAKVDLISMRVPTFDGESRDVLALVFNDHQMPVMDKALAKRGCVKCRTKLTIAVSVDGGRTWKRSGLPFADDLAPTLRLHYPTLIADTRAPCSILVVYTRFHLRRAVAGGKSKGGKRNSSATAPSDEYDDVLYTSYYDDEDEDESEGDAAAVDVRTDEGVYFARTSLQF